MVLESIYDLNFPDTSHFYLGQGFHFVLRRIKEEWGTSRWFLEFDIRKCFHTIDRHRLIPIFKEEIDDPKFFYPIQEKTLANPCGLLDESQRWRYHKFICGHRDKSYVLLQVLRQPLLSPNDCRPPDPLGRDIPTVRTRLKGLPLSGSLQRNLHSLLPLISPPSEPDLRVSLYPALIGVYRRSQRLAQKGYYTIPFDLTLL
ncbi:hypothetical protein RND71_005653 [Anisodus tanguticus]|uniref:Maturase K n=1 Tax=Anisodus tanguticus TaxID=243964 RepID=A0AAE1SUM0_9SOLA|nr:hypothetical protein RND71_005653 [Anisodus tanguticus]